MLIKLPGARWMMQRYFRATRSMTLGVRGLLIDEQGRVLLIRHGYAHGWHFPGGGVEKGESLLTALTREVHEEAGATLTAPPALHGIFTNFENFPSDHVAVFTVRAFTRQAPVPTYEVQEQAFFAPNALPEGTTDGTRRRIAEIFEGRVAAETW